MQETPARAQRQAFRSEVHKEHVAFGGRVDEMRAVLEEEGWVLTE